MNLFAHIAGRSEDTFSLAGVTFEAAPLTLAEVGEFFAVREAPGGNTLDARCEWLAPKLRGRVVRPADPIVVTAEWLLEHLSLPVLGKVEHLLEHGELPQVEDGAKKA